MRILVPQVWHQRSDLVSAHAIEIMAIAPELSGLLGAPSERFASAMAGGRIPDPSETRRFAHGAVNFLCDWSRHLDRGRLQLSFSRVDEADHTDQEFLAILLRRADPELLAATVATYGERINEELSLALHAYTERTEERRQDRLADCRAADDLLRAYIASDGTTTDPAQIAAYQDADPASRATLHDERAAELENVGEWSLRLGAIPYHLEHGSDPGGAGSKALLEAANYCLSKGFYDALLDFGQRGMGATDATTQLERYWLLSGKAATAFAALGQLDEAEALYLKLRALSAMPVLHMNNSHALGILSMRRNLDYGVTRAHLNNALAIASLLPDRQERALYSMVIRSSLASHDIDAGYVPAALAGLTAGLERLDAELDPASHLDHRSVFAHRRATALVRLDRLDEAIREFAAAIEMDPQHPVYYADRGVALLRLGRLKDALSDYDAAVASTPPYWELHHDRAQARTEAGDTAGAIEDLTLAIDLEPAQLDPWVSLAGLLVDAGDLTAARTRIEQGLRFHPDDPLLICLRAQVHVAQGRADLAWQDFDLALAGDTRLVAALAGRADLAYEAGDHRGAIADLTRAIEVNSDDPDLRYNRALLYQATSDWRAAINDYTYALGLPGTDQDELRANRDHCYTQLHHIKPAGRKRLRDTAGAS